jgi:glycosyltransferase involved in cell wall biosynthesis
VTPYWREPRRVIEACIESVACQSLAADHVLVADGRAARHKGLGACVACHIELGRHWNDYGATPRAIGLEWAIAQGYDAIALLDADNRFEPDHLEQCLAASRLVPCDYVTSGRHLVDEKGAILPLEDEDFRDHVDTNVLFLLPGAYRVAPVWARIPAPLHRGGDRFFYAALRSHGCRRLHLGRNTVRYYTRVPAHYRALGHEPPAAGNALPDWPEIERWIRQMPAHERSAIERETGVYLRDLSSLMPMLAPASGETIWYVT